MSHLSAKKTESARLINEGMGGFLNPPDHPEHKWSVETDLRRKPENRGSMSLSHALTCDYLDNTIKIKIRRLLAQWDKNKSYIGNPLRPELLEWVYQVLGYFNGCYQAENGSWEAGKLVIDSKRDPMKYVDTHAGVNLIRQFYVEYEPKEEHFKKAKWGN